ncbi:helix-turn-helix transcriptional regulator [Pseudoxanthomonas sp. PXM05]|nr:MULTISPECIES: helix-turn-helix domain-containing protein [unclassified Pseudoxanthomonas]MBV7472662.1 helix-turn-helix transcriptional regulator [Pseudoxanthomonas sp. PXM05]
MTLLAGKWALPILTELARGPVRNNALLRRIDGVSQKVLTQNLRELERSGLIERIDHGTVPPSVEYRLTDLGRSLDRTLVGLDRWAERHHAALAEARAQHDLRRVEPE